MRSGLFNFDSIQCNLYGFSSNRTQEDHPDFRGDSDKNAMKQMIFELEKEDEYIKGEEEHVTKDKEHVKEEEEHLEKMKKHSKELKDKIKQATSK